MYSMVWNGVIVSLVLLFANAWAVAQSPNTLPSGSTMDSLSKQPVKYVTLRIEDSTAHAVKTILTTDSGVFILPVLPAGNYRLQVSATGYSGKAISFTVRDTSLPVRTGIIWLMPQHNTLTNVTITAKPPLIRQEIDRLAFDVQADPENKINNVLEMLRKVPLITLDAEDNIQLKGSSSFRILINGKTSALVSGNVKDVLRSMPASSIEKIEVITIPPAKYEAEGLAGIINIVTTKKIDDGYKGNVNTYYRLPITAPGIGASFSMKKGKWGLNFYGGYNEYRAPEQTASNYRETSGAAPTVLQTINRQVYNGAYGYGGLELSYAIDSLRLFTAELNVYNNRRNTTNRQRSDITNAQQQLLQHFQLLNEANNTSNGFGGGVNYQLGFNNQKNRLLTFSYKFNRNNGGQTNTININDAFNYRVPDYRQFNNSRFTEQTLQADYVVPINANEMLETGVKAILRNNESDFRYLSKDSSTGKYSEVPAFSNVFDNTQTVGSIYASLQYAVDTWSIKGGIRMEATFVQADFFSTTSAVNQRYFNIIPSLSAQRKYANNKSITIGFTQRIQRPGINQLNPFVDRSNPNFESTGNPGLHPVLSNNAEISFSSIRKLTVITSLSYSFVNNNIQQAVWYEPVSKITRSFYDNIGKERSLAGNISINWPLNEHCNVTLSGTLGYLWFSGTVNGRLVTNSGTKANIRTGLTYAFKKGWRLNTNLNYYLPFITLQGYSSHYLNPSTSISKEIKHFTFSLASINYFSTYLSYEQRTSGTDFMQRFHTRYFNRSFVFSINYRFGKLSKQLEKNKRGINNDDLSGN